MALIFRAKINWTGFVGAPGYSVFHARSFEADPANEAAQFKARVNFFAAEIAAVLPNSVTLTTDPEVEQLEDTTGTLTEVVSTPGSAPIAGTGGTTYSAPAGAVVNWTTGQIRNGRRMRGRTFIVPLALAAYEADGTIVASVRNTILTAASNLANAVDTQLCVYGRPTPLAADGMNGRVTGFSVPDMSAVLRSRRD